MTDFVIHYEAIFSRAPKESAEGTIAFLMEELPCAWVDKYLEMTHRTTNLCRFRHLSFEYIFDHYSDLIAKELVTDDPKIQDRIVAAMGRSAPLDGPRDSLLLRRWVGPTEKRFGPGTDKGHFIAHTLGGEIGVNIFPQLRSTNRGWSERGKVFRSMERYCFRNPGTFCFNRPIYLDNSFRPSAIEFGILTSPGRLWVECFDNCP